MASSTPSDQPASVDPVVEANRRVHSLLVSQYNESEPNLRPKSQAKVCRRLETLAALVPNRAFWNSVYSASEAAGRPIVTIVERGIDELVIHEQELQVQFGIDPVDWRITEPANSGGKEFDVETLGGEADVVGFEAVVEFEWCLGQAVDMHGPSMEAAAVVDDHLHTLLPVSAYRFKRLILTGSKR